MSDVGVTQRGPIACPQIVRANTPCFKCKIYGSVAAGSARLPAVGRKARCLAPALSSLCVGSADAGWENEHASLSGQGETPNNFASLPASNFLIVWFLPPMATSLCLG